MTAPGINVVGYLHAENGVGEAARLLIGAADAAGIRHAEVAISGPHRDLHPYSGTNAFESPQSTNVVCVNADVFAPIGNWLRDTPFGDRPTVGWWAWEIEEFPEWMADNARYVDAIWTNGNLARNAIAPTVDVPVHTFNPPIPLRSGPPPNRTTLGLPAGFVFLFCFDYLSVFERKNPIAVVEAFARAFRPGEGPTLVVKGLNGDQCAPQRDALVAAAAGRPDIRIWHSYIDAGNQRDLMAACDAYVSLHRSEGFGLTLAEAMAAGIPVIGTGYSGNLDFMDEDNSFLVPYTMTPVPASASPYPAGAHWAEPDVDAAAALMRRAFEDPAEVARRVANARRDLLANHSLAVRGERLDWLLRDLKPRRRPGPPRLSAGTVKQRARDRAGSVVRRLAGVGNLEQRVDWLQHEVAGRIDTLEQQLRRLVAQIEDPPYVSDAAALRVVGEDGRERLGFDAPGAQDRSFYEEFEALFRGSEEMIRERLETYMPLLAGREPVVDVGCGRGELLDLLAARSIDAWGVELDPEVAQTPLRKGHVVKIDDACHALRAVEPATLGAVFSSQVVEHMPSGAVADLIAAARQALRPGGVFIAETVNPHAIAAFRTFWLDPTHVHPIFPETLLLLCRAAGFARGYVMFPTGSGDLETDRTTRGEYAVIAEIG